MFENIHIIINTINQPQNMDNSINQNIRVVCDIVDEHNMKLAWLLIEMIVYIIYGSIRTFYTYTLWSLCKPVQTIQFINKVFSSVQYQIYPAEIRHSMYKDLFKTLLFDIIRAFISFYVYFQIQKLFIWNNTE
jgi:hypothetical protein